MFSATSRISFSRLYRKIVPLFVNYTSTLCEIPKRKGLVIGVYDGCEFTKTAEKFDNETNGKLKASIFENPLELGKSTVFHHLISDYHTVALVGVGRKDIGFNEAENLNETKENIRIASAAGAKKLQNLGITDIDVEGFSNAEAAAEGSILGVWKFEDLKSKNTHSTQPICRPYDAQDKDLWCIGEIKAKAQNFARMLEQCPSNIMTPTHFAKYVVGKLCSCGVKVQARDKDWMAEHKMSTLLKMTRASHEPPVLLELAYCGAKPDDKPVVLVGKGVTFDSRSPCLDKDSPDNIEHSADTAGAAVVVGVFKALSKLNVPINCNAVIPLCENMPGRSTAAPSLVPTSITGTTISVDNVRHDGRIFLVDALTYAERYKPCLTINVATVDETPRHALAAYPSRVFTTSDLIWDDLQKAGSETGDRLWRLPLWHYYTNKKTSSKGVDIATVGKGIGGDPCTAAAFFREFAPKTGFVHLDISGTGRMSSGLYPYLMTGRPVRTIAEFLRHLAVSGLKN